MPATRCAECWGDTAEKPLHLWIHVPVADGWCDHPCHGGTPCWCPTAEQLTELDGVASRLLDETERENQ